MICKKSGISLLFGLVFVGAGLSVALAAESTPSEKTVPSASVFFVEPKNGDTVSSPVHIVFGLKGMKLLPAGKDVKDKTSGHHHVIVDEAPVRAGDAVPMDEKHFHFGKGQTEADLKLPPEKHKLTLQFADGAHFSYGESLSSTIEVTVK